MVPFNARCERGFQTELVREQMFMSGERRKQNTIFTKNINTFHHYHISEDAMQGSSVFGVLKQHNCTEIHTLSAMCSHVRWAHVATAWHVLR